MEGTSSSAGIEANASNFETICSLVAEEAQRVSKAEGRSWREAMAAAHEAIGAMLRPAMAGPDLARWKMAMMGKIGAAKRAKDRIAAAMIEAKAEESAAISAAAMVAPAPAATNGNGNGHRPRPRRREAKPAILGVRDGDARIFQGPAESLSARLRRDLDGCAIEGVKVVQCSSSEGLDSVERILGNVAAELGWKPSPETGKRYRTRKIETGRRFELYVQRLA